MNMSTNPTPPALQTFDEWFEGKHGYSFDHLASTMMIDGAMRFLAAAMREYATVMFAKLPTLGMRVGDLP
ncbi:hypothetical protein [Variovorax sp. JS1663]|uniref:hypothetical protein n=1 Tax=Variovorax sp. JS1663 TaxID=1851577 RepID=UPI000B3441F2|nr:hypothetical protein [Variovorax sp. JS1663]OUM01766.1 hypothetical protein A8M77_14485 [Variovorax sp. JS1663]